MQAIKDDIIIRVPKTPVLSITEGGILLNSSDKFKPIDSPPDSQYGEVISIGELVDEVSVGDQVMYNRFAAKCLGPEYPEYYRVNINEIMGVITE